MTRPNTPESLPGKDLPSLQRMTRRGLVVGVASILAGYGGWRWVRSRGQEGLVPWPLRRVLEFDESVGRRNFDPRRLSREFPPSRARMPRVNGNYGVNLALDLTSWRLKVEGPAGQKSWTLAEIQALPRHQFTTELRCIEGWSEVVTWAGARLSDLAERTGLARRSGRVGNPLDDPADLLPYVGLTTPDRNYFVGLDMPSALHPQTLLCYEMNGAPLTPSHGAPLRLAIPVKYGIKNLKQIGTLQFTDARPSDFWAELGYDWFAGL